MTNSLSLPLEVTTTATPTARPVRVSRPSRRPLSNVELDVPVRVVAVDLDGEMGEWLRAVGISEGERLTVLRRAAFGGPIHVRAGSGGEFAIHRALAKAILIRSDGDEDAA